MPALNVLFWNQVLEANQFTSRALAPLFSDSAARAFVLFFGGIQPWLSAVITIRAKSPTHD
jgi:hypothetical protein